MFNFLERENNKDNFIEMRYTNNKLEDDDNVIGSMLNNNKTMGIKPAILTLQKL